MCTELIFQMIEKSKSDALRHAMIAFAALIYAIKKDPSSIQLSFLHYEKAVQEFRQFLLKNPQQMAIEESQTAIATALVLASAEVLFSLKLSDRSDFTVISLSVFGI